MWQEEKTPTPYMTSCGRVANKPCIQLHTRESRHVKQTQAQRTKVNKNKNTRECDMRIFVESLDNITVSQSTGSHYIKSHKNKTYTFHWHLLTLIGTYWHILTHFDTFWHILTHFDTSLLKRIINIWSSHYHRVLLVIDALTKHNFIVSLIFVLFPKIDLINCDIPRRAGVGLKWCEVKRLANATGDSPHSNTTRLGCADKLVAYFTSQKHADTGQGVQDQPPCHHATRPSVDMRPID